MMCIAPAFGVISKHTESAMLNAKKFLLFFNEIASMSEKLKPY